MGRTPSGGCVHDPLCNIQLLSSRGILSRYQNYLAEAQPPTVKAKVMVAAVS